MSPIGRIFVVLNLILSAAFLGWAANALDKTAHYKDEMAKAKTAHEEALATKDQELSKMRGDLNGVTEQQRAFREERDQFKAESDQLKTQLDELRRANDTMQGNLTKIQATLGDYNNSIQQLSQQKDAAIERAHDAERARDAAVQEKDAAVIAQRDAEEKTKAAETRIGDLEGEKVALASDVEKLQTRLDVVVKRTNTPLNEVMVQKPIDAVVLDVNKDLKLVILNKGKKDEVKVGYTFDVYRGTQYKGQVQIRDVQEGISSGIITSEASPIGKGDSASTSL